MKPPESISLKNRPAESGVSQFRPADIAYLLFRHKWKIILLGISGVIGAAALYFTEKPVYISQAKLLIKYVQESRAVGPADSGDSIRTPDSRGDNILNTEVELIRTLDLAREVAAAVGPTNIVQLEGAEATPDDAAGEVLRGIIVDAPKRSNILLLAYRHGNPVVARNVLTNLVAGYLRLHARVHRAVGDLENYSRQADMRRQDLDKIQTQLREAKDTLGISNLDEAKSLASQELNRVRQEINSTDALLAEAQASLGLLVTNALATSATSSGTTNETASPTPVQATIPRDKLAAYEGILSTIDLLRKRRQDLRLQWTESSVFVTKVTDELTRVEGERAALENEFPGIASYASGLLARSGSSSVSSAAADRTAEISRVAGLRARRETLQRQLTQAQTDLSKLRAKEPDILDLENKLALYDKEYRFYSRAAEEARVNAFLTSGRLANIDVVQAASPPTRDITKFYQILAGVLFGGFAIGIGLAVALEFYFDQTLRRPNQVAGSLNIPVFLTIPKLKNLDTNFPARSQLPAPDTNGDADAGAVSVPSEISEPAGPLDAYAEALRDRVIMHFQVRELHHKPKLVGITSCGKDAGATTIATHLAASLSETGEGNVLYVDANPNLGPTVKAFYRGKQAASIASVLDHDARAVAKVNDTFYLAALNDHSGSGKVGVLPKKLATLLPKMKASDFDYIIFDLPPVTQTSATPRVAGLLDMTLLVLESEKTHGDLAKQVTGLLKQSRADVAAVLNKHHRYLPQNLDPDL